MTPTESALRAILLDDSHPLQPLALHTVSVIEFVDQRMCGLPGTPPAVDPSLEMRRGHPEAEDATVRAVNAMLSAAHPDLAPERVLSRALVTGTVAEFEARPQFALEVFIAAARWASMLDDADLQCRALWRASINARESGRTADAFRLLAELENVALRAVNRLALFQGRWSYCRTLVASGNYPAADAAYTALQAELEQSEFPDLLAQVMWTRAVFFARQSRYLEGIRLGHQAMIRATGLFAVDMLVDLGMMLLMAGETRTAWVVNEVVLNHPTSRHSPRTRFNAIANQMEIAARHHDSLTFDRYRRRALQFIQTGYTKPYDRLDFHLQCARGLLCLGLPTASLAAAAQALDIAIAHGFHAAAFEAETLITSLKKRDRASSDPADTSEPPSPFPAIESSEETEAVATAVLHTMARIWEHDCRTESPFPVQDGPFAGTDWP